MKTVVIGANGQLGTDIVTAYGPEGAVPLTHSDIELTDPDSIGRMVELHKPEVIINTAAYHNVPDCEKNIERAFLVNSVALKLLADICTESSIKLAHVSTDYVFDGKKDTPYIETDPVSPLNVYGVSKAAGEEFVKRVEGHYIFRVSSIFGTTGCRGKGGTNFVESIIRFAGEREFLEVSSNIVSSPTYTLDAAYAIKDILESGKAPGIYHVSNAGAISWHEFAVEIVKQIGSDVEVRPIEEIAARVGVQRPYYSPLESLKITPLRDWKEALAAYLKAR